jgi:hypothetical protein
MTFEHDLVEVGRFVGLAALEDSLNSHNHSLGSLTALFR